MLLVDNYIYYCDWSDFDVCINDAINKGLTPVILIGNAYNTTLRFQQGSTIKKIAPGTIRGANQDNFIGVSGDLYLHYLELFARSLARRYGEDINYWQTDNELDAARYAEAWDILRKGSLWHDDSVGGFQDIVAQTIYNAVKDEDTYSGNDVIQVFHVFGLGRRVKDMFNLLLDIKAEIEVAVKNNHAENLISKQIAGFEERYDKIIEKASSRIHRRKKRKQDLKEKESNNYQRKIYLT